MSKIDNAIKVAKKMNTLINFNLLSIPVLDDFILVQKNLTDPNNNIIFVAVKNFLFSSAEDTLGFIGKVQEMPMSLIIIVIIAFCVLVEFISYFCSVRIMDKKEL